MSAVEKTLPRSAKQIAPDRCCGVIIDVQNFLVAGGQRIRSRIKTNTRNFARLLNYFGIPIVVTLESRLIRRAPCPGNQQVSWRSAETFREEFLRLDQGQENRAHLEQLNRKQVVLAGCETDVCVLQSCLGLLSLGYEVYLVEELLFSSSRNVESATARMQVAAPFS